MCAFLAAAAIAGCGGTEESSTTTASKERLYPWVKGPTREFLVRGGDNAVQLYGREATKEEREQAERVIRAWMRARAEKNWAKDCSYYSREYSKSLTADAHGVTDGKVKSCPEALAYFKEQASGDYANTLGDKPIVSLRVGIFKGQKHQGFAQYHGNDGEDWIIGVQKDEGLWKVSSSAPLRRNE